MLLKNHFSWFKAGALCVERLRTDLKLGSEPPLKLHWWKRGISGLVSKSPQHNPLMDLHPVAGRAVCPRGGRTNLRQDYLVLGLLFCQKESDQDEEQWIYLQQLNFNTKKLR